MSNNGSTTLYHYCTAETLQGILESRIKMMDHREFLDIVLDQNLDDDAKRQACDQKLRTTIHRGTIRATSMAYLNDKEEYVHGEDYFVNAVKASADPFIVSVSSNLQAKLVNPAERTQRLLKTHVFCLSFRKNSLSQWRAYGNNGSGYAIGFDRTKTNLDPGADYTLKPVGMNLSSGGSFPVIYQDAIKAQLVALIIDAAGQWFASTAASYGFNSADLIHLAIAVELITILVAVYSPMMKHNAFAEEDEYRIVLNSQYGQYDHLISTFPSNGLMKPYIELHAIHQWFGPMPPNGGTIPPHINPVNLPISEIITGPCLEPIRAKYGLEILLANKNYSGVNVNPSGIPYLP